MQSVCCMHYTLGITVEMNINLYLNIIDYLFESVDPRSISTCSYGQFSSPYTAQNILTLAR
jgi:hypothetical protein